MATTQTLTEKNIDAAVQKGGTLFIGFWATNCEFSAEFAPRFAAVAKKHKKVVFAKVDIDADETLADDFEIEGTPTLVVIRDGVVVAREEGAMPADELEEIVAGVGTLDMDFIRSELAAEQTQAAGKKKPVAKKPAAKKPAAKKPAAKKPAAKKPAAKKPAAKKKK